MVPPTKRAGSLISDLERILILKYLIFLIFLFVNHSFAASFDCKKAATTHEKFICNTPDLNEADTQLGNAYKSAMSNFRFPGWLREDQIGWLYGYRKCEALKKCLDLIKNRIDELNAYQKSDVYTNYKGNKFMAGELTIIMSEILGVKKARFLGAWMPPMDISGELKGYPFDGFWCDEEVELIRKGNVFVSEGRGISLQTDSAKVLMKGHLICNARTGFPEGTYLK